MPWGLSFKSVHVWKEASPAGEHSELTPPTSKGSCWRKAFESSIDSRAHPAGRLCCATTPFWFASRTCLPWKPEEKPPATGTPSLTERKVPFQHNDNVSLLLFIISEVIYSFIHLRIKSGIQLNQRHLNLIKLIIFPMKLLNCSLREFIVLCACMSVSET